MEILSQFALRALVEAPPLLLVKRGVFQTRAMRKEFITKDEILAKLREEGIQDVAQIKQVQLESDGQLSIIRFDNQK